MYLLIDTMQKEDIKAGDPVVLKLDTAFGLVGAFGIGGETLGYLSSRQPDGCGDPWTVYTRIGINRIIATAAVVFEGGILLQTNSAVLQSSGVAVRREYAGYGVCVPQ